MESYRKQCHDCKNTHTALQCNMRLRRSSHLTWRRTGFTSLHMAIREVETIWHCMHLYTCKKEPPPLNLAFFSYSPPREGIVCFYFRRLYISNFLTRQYIGANRYFRFFVYFDQYITVIILGGDFNSCGLYSIMMLTGWNCEKSYWIYITFSKFRDCVFSKDNLHNGYITQKTSDNMYIVQSSHNIIPHSKYGFNR